MTTTQSPFVPVNEYFSPDNDQLLIQLTSNHTLMANLVNDREIALYQDHQETITGQQFSTAGTNQTKKYTFRKVFYFGAIAPGATLSIAHGIANLVQFTRLYGTCITTVVDYRPLPFIDSPVAGGEISLMSTSTNINITLGAASPNVSSGIIVAEYLCN
jgi:hypothetical protein